MSRRDYPVAEVYEDREREFYRNGRRAQTREYTDFEEDVRTNRTPDFLREGYGRPSSNAGPLVVRERQREDFDDTRSYGGARSVRGSPPRRREVEREEIIIRDNKRSEPDLRRRPRERESEEIDIDIRRRETNDDTRSVRSSRRPRERETEETDIDIDIRRRQTNDDTRSVRSSRPREYERDDITIRRAETERLPPPPPASRRQEEEIIIRRGEREDFRPPPPRPMPAPSVNERTDIDIDINRKERGPRGRFESDDLDIDISHQHSHGRRRSTSRDRVVIRERSQSRGPRPRERSMPPGNLVRRDHEEFVIRRRRPSPSPSPSPPPPPVRDNTSTQEIIIRRTERSTPSPPPPPPMPEPVLPPPPVMQPIIRPPIHQEIHQEIITHHRHIDHGVERARSPSPLPPPPPPPAPEPVVKDETLEIDIRRETSHGRHGHKHSEEDLEIDIRHSHGRQRSRSPSVVSRARSVDASLSRRHHYHDELEEEAAYYNRKALERGYPGEAYNGATRDWALVDVPPGTERVRMDGAGGGAQEITWQRYNGVRRSKFMSGGREFDTGYGESSPVGPVVGPTRPRAKDMWTEVTKDLVVKDAIEALGYEYEETDAFFYVMEYLRYEDVLQLVEVSDDIRRQRRRRLRELEWERSAVDRRRDDDKSFYEKEVIIDRRERRGHDRLQVDIDEWYRHDREQDAGDKQISKAKTSK